MGNPRLMVFQWVRVGTVPSTKHGSQWKQDKGPRLLATQTRYWERPRTWLRNTRDIYDVQDDVSGKGPHVAGETHSANAPLVCEWPPLMNTERVSPSLTKSADTSRPSATTSPTASQPRMAPVLLKNSTCIQSAGLSPTAVT